MVNVKTVLIYHIHGCDDPKKECEILLMHVVDIWQTIVDNDKPVIPTGGN